MKTKSNAKSMMDSHLKKVKGYVKNDMKEDKRLLKENVKIDKAITKESRSRANHKHAQKK